MKKGATYVMNFDGKGTKLLLSKKSRCEKADEEWWKFVLFDGKFVTMTSL